MIGVGGGAAPAVRQRHAEMVRAAERHRTLRHARTRGRRDDAAGSVVIHAPKALVLAMFESSAVPSGRRSLLMSVGPTGPDLLLPFGSRLLRRRSAVCVTLEAAGPDRVRMAWTSRIRSWVPGTRWLLARRLSGQVRAWTAAVSRSSGGLASWGDQLTVAARSVVIEVGDGAGQRRAGEPSQVHQRT